MNRCDEHARRLDSIEEFLRCMHKYAKRSGNATLLGVAGLLVTVLVAIITGYFQLAAARAEIRKDCPQQCDARSASR